MAPTDENSQSRISVWWDMDSCGIPSDENSAHLIVEFISKAVVSVGLSEPMTLSAYGDSSQICPSVVDYLIKSGVNLRSIKSDRNAVNGYALIVEMLLWALDNPSANVFLISGNANFSSALHGLKKRRYRILLAHTSDTSKSLITAANHSWLWEDLVGKSISKLPLTKSEPDSSIPPPPILTPSPKSTTSEPNLTIKRKSKAKNKPNSTKSPSFQNRQTNKLRSNEPEPTFWQSKVQEILTRLKIEKLPPTEDIIISRLAMENPAVIHSTLPIMSYLQSAVSTGYLVRKPVGSLFVLLPSETPECWDFINLNNREDVYPTHVWQSLYFFLNSLSGSSKIQYSSSRFNAAEIIHEEGPSELASLSIGELVHMLLIAEEMKGWIKRLTPNWLPIQISLPVNLFFPSSRTDEFVPFFSSKDKIDGPPFPSRCLEDKKIKSDKSKTPDFFDQISNSNLSFDSKAGGKRKKSATMDEFRKWFTDFLNDRNELLGFKASLPKTKFESETGLLLDFNRLGFDRMTELIKSFSDIVTFKRGLIYPVRGKKEIQIFSETKIEASHAAGKEKPSSITANTKMSTKKDRKIKVNQNQTNKIFSDSNLFHEDLFTQQQSNGPLSSWNDNDTKKMNPVSLGVIKNEVKIGKQKKEKNNQNGVDLNKLNQTNDQINQTRKSNETNEKNEGWEDVHSFSNKRHSNQKKMDLHDHASQTYDQYYDLNNQNVQSYDESGQYYQDSNHRYTHKYDRYQHHDDRYQHHGSNFQNHNQNSHYQHQQHDQYNNDEYKKYIENQLNHDYRHHTVDNTEHKNTDQDRSSQFNSKSTDNTSKKDKNINQTMQKSHAESSQGTADETQSEIVNADSAPPLSEFSPPVFQRNAEYEEVGDWLHHVFVRIKKGESMELNQVKSMFERETGLILDFSFLGFSKISLLIQSFSEYSLVNSPDDNTNFMVMKRMAKEDTDVSAVHCHVSKDEFDNDDKIHGKPSLPPFRSEFDGEDEGRHGVEVQPAYDAIQNQIKTQNYFRSKSFPQEEDAPSIHEFVPYRLMEKEEDKNLWHNSLAARSNLSNRLSLDQTEFNASDFRKLKGAMDELKEEKLPPFKEYILFKLSEILFDEERRIVNPALIRSRSQTLMENAIKQHALISKKVEKNFLFLFENEQCWEFIDINDPHDAYSSEIWNAFESFLLSEHRRLLILSSGCYQAAKTIRLHSTAIMQFLPLGVIMHILQLSITSKKWMKASSDWFPLSILYPPLPSPSPSSSTSASISVSQTIQMNENARSIKPKDDEIEKEAMAEQSKPSISMEEINDRVPKDNSIPTMYTNESTLKEQGVEGSDVSSMDEGHSTLKEQGVEGIDVSSMDESHSTLEDAEVDTFSPLSPVPSLTTRPAYLNPMKENTEPSSSSDPLSMASPSPDSLPMQTNEEEKREDEEEEKEEDLQKLPRASLLQIREWLKENMPVHVPQNMCIELLKTLFEEKTKTVLDPRCLGFPRLTDLLGSFQDLLYLDWQSLPSTVLVKPRRPQLYNHIVILLNKILPLHPKGMALASFCDCFLHEFGYPLDPMAANFSNFEGLLDKLNQLRYWKDEEGKIWLLQRERSAGFMEKESNPSLFGNCAASNGKEDEKGIHGDGKETSLMQNGVGEDSEGQAVLNIMETLPNSKPFDLNESAND